MNIIKRNPVLEFLLDAADAAQYVWRRYLEQIDRISWKKLLWLSLLALIVSSLLILHGLVTLLVFCSVILKCFMPKQPQAEPEAKSDQLPAVAEAERGESGAEK